MVLLVLMMRLVKWLGCFVVVNSVVVVLMFGLMMCGCLSVKVLVV